MRLASSRSFAALTVCGLSLLTAVVQAQTYGKGDCLMENCLPSQSGYLDGYNFDPAVVGSSSFGQLWTVSPGRASQVYLAQPLTYTPPGGTQSVIVASEDNNVYILDAATGATRASMLTQAPFLATDSQCTDVVPNIGITGTPYLSTDLNTLFFWSKGYVDPTGQSTGLNNGRYKFYGVDPVTLTVKFATDPQGIQAGNRPDQYFEGGKQLQRTGLTLLNGVVYAGFGGHCDNFNYTGWVIGMDAKTGAFVTSFTTEAGLFGTTGAGIWQAGGGIPNDGQNIWVVTGNGAGEELGTSPRIGRSPPGAFPMSVIKLALSSINSLTPVDFFTPSDFRAIDGADQDFGSSGVCLLPTGFSTGSIGRLAIANGKNSKAYIMNADNLGGYKTGAGGGDGNLQTIPLGGPSFSTVGGYPFEGGYIYISSTSSPTIAYKLITDSNGNPNFIQVGQTNDTSTGTRGIGHTTTTSYMGQPGSGLLWVTDLTNGNVRVYPAVPPADGNMQAIFIGTVPFGGVKYQRVVPGNGRMFVVGSMGWIAGFGSPVNQPLNCTSPLAFGSVVQGKNMTLPVTCKATINTQISNVTVSDPSIKFSNFPTVGTSYTANSAPFAFNVTWSPVKLGAFTGSVNIGLTNGEAGYVTNVPVVIRGSAVASAPTFQLSPNNVAFGGLVPGSSETVGGVNKSVQLSNQGIGTLKIIGWDFDEVWGVNLNAGDDDDDSLDGTDFDGTMDDNTSTGNFTLYGMPSSVASQSSVGLTLNFNPSINGDWKANLTIYTNGGNSSTLLTGSADGPPVMTYSTQQYDGRVLQGVPYMDFGNLLAGNLSTLVLSVTNKGESALTITKSKPPNDQVIHAVNPASDLTEGQTVGPNTTATGAVQLQTQGSQVNVPAYNASSQWVLNGNDPNFGVTFVMISGRIVSRQVGPRLNVSDPWDKNGTARFAYLGCYQDYGAQNRTFPTQIQVNSNDNGVCMGAALQNGPANFVGTEYSVECYSSLQPPKTAKVSDLLCTMSCSNDRTQVCGDSGYLSVFYDKLAYNATSGTFLPGAYTGPVNVANVTAPSGKVYSYVGCASDTANPRTLGAYSYIDGSNMSVEACVATCASKGYPWAGVEYGQECYCDNSLPANTNTYMAGCTTACKGSINEVCGGTALLSLYALKGTNVTGPGTTTTITATTTATPTSTGTATSTTITSISTVPFATPTSSGIVPAVGSATYRGCWNDTNPNLRTLSTLYQSESTVTVEGCVRSCTNAGYPISGLENGQDCWCGNGLSPGTVKVDDGQCNYACAGNSLEYCGGNLVMVTYSANPIAPATQPASFGNWTFQGCFPDSTAARTLQGAAPNIVATNSLENCASACSAFTYFGTEYGRECYCGNAIMSGATAGDPSLCNMVCSGNGTEICGAGNQLSVYKNPNLAPAPGGGPSTGPGTGTGGTGGSTPTGAQPTTIGNWTLQGCFNDSVNARALQGSVPNLGSSNSLENCAAACSSFLYFGTEYGQECYCGNSILNGAVAGAANLCSMACSGNSTELCGAGNQLSLYKNSSPSSPSSGGAGGTATGGTGGGTGGTGTSGTGTGDGSTSTAVQPTTVGNFTLQGCYSDSVNARTLQGQTPSLGSSNTLEACASACSKFLYFGTEYGQECYCGNQIMNGAVAGASSACSMPCAGNSTELCGAGNQLSLYKNNAPVTIPPPPSQPSAISGTWSFQGCYNDSVASRTLQGLNQNSASSTSLESCASICAGFQYFGTEYGQEIKLLLCHKLITLQHDPLLLDFNRNIDNEDRHLYHICHHPVTYYILRNSQRNIKVHRHQHENYNHDYQHVKPFRYPDDAAPANRSLPILAYQNSSNTVNTCALYCRNAGYRYSGTEAGKSCYCGNFLQYYAASAGSGQTGCTTACTGDSTQKCGGTNRINIVQDLNWKQSLYTVAKTGKWAFKECYTDSASARTLNVTLTGTAITVDKCLTACYSKQLKYCGMGSGTTCFGAQVLPNNATVAPFTGSTDPQARGCNVRCAGNSTQACGGASRLDVYYFNSTASSVSPATVQIIS
ncbi:hypothetical protein OC861_006141 [Tilletia horrida]|nr:hypothetical protein OC861_006141 [Tilletia horrida]